MQARWLSRRKGRVGNEIAEHAAHAEALTELESQSARPSDRLELARAPVAQMDRARAF